MLMLMLMRFAAVLVIEAICPSWDEEGAERSSWLGPHPTPLKQAHTARF